MKIKNYSTLLDLPPSSKEISSRDFLLKLVTIAIDSVDPFEVVTRNLQFQSSSKSLIISNSKYDINNKHVRVIGVGKAVGRMAVAIENILEGVPLSGIICVPEGVKKSLNLEKIQCLESTHPLPSNINLENTEKTLDFLREISSEDFVIGLISGGGSALWSAPIPPITINDLKAINLTLLHSGMSIHEINVIRKHLSQIKGGKLAQRIPATTVVLVLSDVIGDQIESIASGPFAPDRTTYNDVINILNRYNLSKKGLPETVYYVIVKGVNGEIADTPKPENSLFSRFHPYVIGSNTLAREAIFKVVDDIGVKVINDNKLVDGDARIVGADLARLGLRLIEENSNPVLYISGGEPIVKVRGIGTGGRNQEVVAAFLRELRNLDTFPDISLISFGTDGIDGNSQYAGAICDGFTMSLFREKKVPIDFYQENNDLTNFFLQIGKSLILLGPTGTNVMDIHLLLVNSGFLSEIT